MMSLIILEFLLSLINFAWSNCELYQSGFHTIANYEGVRSLENSKKFYRYHHFNRSILLDYGAIGSIENLKIQEISFFGQRCTDSSVGMFYGVQSERPQIAVNLCSAINPKDYPTTFLLYDKSEKKLKIPHKVELKPLKDFNPEKLVSLENNIKLFLKDKIFRGTDQLSLDPEDYEVLNFEHHIYDTSELILTIANAQSLGKNSQIKYKFKVVFLSLDQQPWYIADSAYIDPCSSLYNENYPRPQQQENIGYIELFKYGWIYTDERAPSFLQFDEKIENGMYQLFMYKDLSVIEKGSDRKVPADGSSHGLGLIPKKEIKK